MQGYYLMYLIIFLLVIFLIVRYIVLNKISPADELFRKGLKNENNGNYDEAIMVYEQALKEAERTKWHHGLKVKLIEKLNVLRTVSSYQKSQDFIRQNGSK